MQLGVVTTSYPRFPGDPAGNFVAAHVAALRAIGHRVEVIAAGSGAVTGEPRDATRGGVNRPALPGERGRESPLLIADEPRDATRGGVNRPALPGEPAEGEQGKAPLWINGGLGLFYAGGAPDALERSPLRAGLAAAAFTARLTAAVAASARRWDAIVAHWLAPSALAALPTGRPLIAIAHGGDVFTLRRLRLLGPVLRALHRRGARLVLVSEQLREIARTAAPALAGWLDGALVQPMGVDAARFAALPRAPSDPPTVLCAARLVPIKGVDVALAAMRHVQAAARLVIAGDGPERTRLARAAAAAPGAALLGEVPTGRRDDLLSTASVVVVPSRVTPGGRTEGTPAIALEALAAGVPVVASAVGGLRGLAGRAGVQLVPPDDPRALAAAIDRALADPPPPAALRAAVADLDWREVAPRLLRA